MKKIKLDGKLSLNKETIAKLNDEQMSEVKGGEKTRSCETSQCPSTPANPSTCGTPESTCVYVDGCNS